MSAPEANQGSPSAPATTMQRISGILVEAVEGGDQRAREGVVEGVLGFRRVEDDEPDPSLDARLDAVAHPG